MNTSNKDTFESAKQNIFNNISNHEENNFFLMDETSVMNKKVLSTSERQRRLNDYDFNLLKEDAYKDISDDVFKLEYKISKTEDEIKDIDAQIEAAKEINDTDLIIKLSDRKKSAQEDYEALLAIYNDKSISAKITDSLANTIGISFKDKAQKINNGLSKFYEALVSKMPKRFASVIELKKSLTKLENINKSVDELISLNIPYGENVDKYQQLSKFIIKANSIQAEIAKHLK